MYLRVVEKSLYMRRCLELAAMAYPACRPNPMVGAVLVRNGQVISEGFTSPPGGAHAEVNAIASVPDELLLESTLYVSLEPCAHFGRTPPCANLIVEKKIPRVVVATLDPHEKVAGKGIDILRQSGLDVRVGLLESEAQYLNRRFFTYHQKKRPYIVLKWAESSDGFVDRFRVGGKASAISSEQSRQWVHRWRSEEQGILVGGRTARMDNPRLDVRVLNGPSPQVFIWSSRDLDSSYFLAQKGYERFECSTVHELVDALYARGLQSLLVEGGPRVLQQFIDMGCYDEIRRIRSNKSLGTGVRAPFFTEDKCTDRMRVGNDQIEFFSNQASN